MVLKAFDKRNFEVQEINLKSGLTVMVSSSQLKTERASCSLTKTIMNQ